MLLASCPQGEGGAAFGGGGGGGGEGFEFGVDPNMDPELAMALQVGAAAPGSAETDAVCKAIAMGWSRGKQLEPVLCLLLVWFSQTVAVQLATEGSFPTGHAQPLLFLFPAGVSGGGACPPGCRSCGGWCPCR